MENLKNKFVVRTKIWIENGSGKVAFGLGRFRILEAIDRCGIVNELPFRLVQNKRIRRTNRQNAGGQAGQGISPHTFCQRFNGTICRTKQNAAGRGG